MRAFNRKEGFVLNYHKLHNTNMLSANKSPQIINVRLSNPYIDTSKPFRDPYLLFESLTSMSHTDIRILYVNLTSQNERCNA